MGTPISWKDEGAGLDPRDGTGSPLRSRPCEVPKVAEQSLAPVEVELLPRCGATYLTVPALIRGQFNSGATG